MAQFLRPDGNVTQTSFTGGFAEIDEATASDADFAYGANNIAAILEVGLNNPTGTPAAGTSTVRYRVAKTNNGVLNGSGATVTVTAEVVQGTSIISTDAARTATGTWAEYSWTPDLSGVTDWTDLRLRFTTSKSGGTTANRRGGAVSWAELEAPDAAAGVTHQGSTALSGTGSLAAAGTRQANASASLSGAGTLSANGTVGGTTHQASVALAGSGTLAGSALRSLSAAFAAAGQGTLAAVSRMTAAARALLGGAGLLTASASIAGQSHRCAKNLNVHAVKQSYRRAMDPNDGKKR